MIWLSDTAYTYCAAFGLNILHQTASSSSILTFWNKQLPSLETVRIDNASIITYFPAVTFPKIYRRYLMLPFCIIIKPKSQFFFSRYLTRQSSVVAKCVRNTNRRLTNVESTGTIWQRKFEVLEIFVAPFTNVTLIC
jgi:hypothetical protein